MYFRNSYPTRSGFPLPLRGCDASTHRFTCLRFHVVACRLTHTARSSACARAASSVAVSSLCSPRTMVASAGIKSRSVRRHGTAREPLRNRCGTAAEPPGNRCAAACVPCLPFACASSPCNSCPAHCPLGPHRCRHLLFRRGHNRDVARADGDVDGHLPLADRFPLRPARGGASGPLGGGGGATCQRSSRCGRCACSPSLALLLACSHVSSYFVRTLYTCSSCNDAPHRLHPVPRAPPVHALCPPPFQPSNGMRSVSRAKCSAASSASSATPPPWTSRGAVPSAASWARRSSSSVPRCRFYRTRAAGSSRASACYRRGRPRDGGRPAGRMGRTGRGCWGASRRRLAVLWAYEYCMGAVGWTFSSSSLELDPIGE